jgi:hypothetical protein
VSHASNGRRKGRQVIAALQAARAADTQKLAAAA